MKQEFGICINTLIPVRNSPSERAEMVTQILFGELFFIKEIQNNWAFIVTEFDDYKGWIDKKTIYLIDNHDFRSIQSFKKKISFKPISYIKDNKNNTIPIAGGSIIPTIDSNGKFTIGSKTFYTDTPLKQQTEVSHTNIIKIAMHYINAPYLWGGRTIFGIDCSGFSQIVYKIAGIALPRDASMQVKAGKSVDNIETILPGDLAFFENSDCRITHVGILIDRNTIIHASGHVRIDKIDNEGVFNNDTKKYTHKLSSIRRII